MHQCWHCSVVLSWRAHGTALPTVGNRTWLTQHSHREMSRFCALHNLHTPLSHILSCSLGGDLKKMTNKLLQNKDKNIFHRRAAKKKKKRKQTILLAVLFYTSHTKQTYSVLLTQLVKSTPIVKSKLQAWISKRSKKTHSIVPVSLLPKLRRNSLFSTVKKMSGRERTFFWCRKKCSIHWTMPYASACFISDALDHSTVSGLSFP